MIVKDDRVLFARWLRNPRRIGAVLPSGLALTRAIAAEVDLARPGAVVELGGGTGAVTRALLAAGVPPADLVVIERDQSLYRLLHERFPGVRVIHGDARKLPALLAKAGVGPVKTVVSGLPLLPMPLKAQMAILSGSFAVMPEDEIVLKHRFSAFIQGSSDLAERLRAQGFEYVLILGTVTTVCCESSARDAMMLNFKTVMVSDGNSARTDQEHAATLASFYVTFGDVMTTDETIACLRANAALPAAAE